MKLTDLGLISEDEQKRLVGLGKGAELPFAADATIADVFRDKAQRSPDLRAVVFGSAVLTYRQLDHWSDRVAKDLSARHGVGPDKIVALCFERSIEMIVAILGVWKAGGAYVPIAPDTPAERVQFILSDTATQVVLCSAAQLGPLEQLAADMKATIVVAITADDADSLPDSAPAAPVPSAAKPDSLAYVVYTSGTSGTPKGVMIENRSVVNHVTVISALYGFADTPGTEVMAQTLTYAFDGGIVPMVLALLSGNTLLLVPEQMWLEPETFTAYLNTHGATHINGTPTFYRTADLGRVQSLKRMIIGGEALDVSCFRKMRGNNDVPVFNEYGPTEATISTTSHAVREFDLAIGRPQSNAWILVLDETLRPTPIGGLGEIFLTGPGIARGYWNAPDLTARNFIQNPFQTDLEKSDLSWGPEGRNARLYRTGDMGRWRSDGVLEYSGRTDTQIKVQGFRVELAEVEAAIGSYPGIEHGVVLAREPDDATDADTAGVTSLVGYYVSPAALNPDDIHRHLERRLPAYMVPQTLVHLTALPLTVNGKLDTQALRSLHPRVQGTQVGAQTELETTLRDVAAGILGLDPSMIGMQDDLFGLGLNSILVVNLISGLKKELKVDIRTSTLFLYPTIEELVGCPELRSLAKDPGEAG